jgi:CubicO group peptidase (beta-lactamase class C family)
MKRRDFLATSVGCGMAVVGCAGQHACGRTESSGETHDKRQSVAVQSEEGVVIHPFESDIMTGFPPSSDNLVTPDIYPSSRPHRVWAHQHMRELCTTQPIRRGDGPIHVLPRRTQDVDEILITGQDGTRTTVASVLRTNFTDAFLVLHEGAIVCEQYFEGMRPNSLHHLWSVSKSISIGVVANLIEEGKLSENAAVEQYIPELAGSGYRGAKIRHLMDMQSGVKYEYGEGSMHDAQTEGGQHFRAAGIYRRLAGENPNEGQYAFFRTLQKNWEHGSLFRYKCCDTAVLGWACERVTGVRFSDLLSRYIWSKLGAEHDSYIVCDVQGSTAPNAGISATVRDLARWGLMHLHGGQYQGRQVVPQQFIRDILAKADPAKIPNDSGRLPRGTAYCNQFWLPGREDGAFHAAGGYGQICYIHPKYATVIVKLSTQEPDYLEMAKTELRAFGEIARALGG